MFIFKSKDGWGASNEAYISEKSEILKENGKTVGVKRHKYITANNVYTVSGTMDGNIKVAIKDDVSGVVSCFNCILDGLGIRILSDCDNSWLKTIK